MPPLFFKHERSSAMHSQDIKASPPDAISYFSVFEGDLVNRCFAHLGIGAKSPGDLLLRIVVILTVTWVPMAVMAYFTPMPDDPVPAQNFFYDFAAYAQFFVGIPLFIIAERIMMENMLATGRDFTDSGVVATADHPALLEAEARVARLRRARKPEIICLLLAFFMGLMTIGPELFITSDMKTWHVTKPLTGDPHLTPAGAWAMFVALPIQIYWWVRWVWKIGLWYWYLSRVSKFRLVLVASHPDRTGGIGFLSEVQAKFAIVILAFGFSNVVATIGYKIAMENAPVELPAVWGPVVGFAIGAPLLFLSPLLLFTKQLARTKKRALSRLREKAMRGALWVESQWLESSASQHDATARDELAQLNLLTGFYERINHMRVVPFDLRSATQLIGSAIGPMIPLLPYFIDIPEPWQKILEALTKWLPH